MGGIFVALALTMTPGLTVSDQLKDAEFLREALVALHPGRFRYQTPAAEEAAFGLLRASLNSPRSLPELHAEIARYLAQYRCGHTHLNPFNQDPSVVAEVYDRADKLPFLFRWIGGEMVVTYPRGTELVRGDRIVELQGQKSREVLRNLISFARADGARDNKRADLMGLSGGAFDEADAYLPLITPPTDGRFQLKVRRGSSGKHRVINVEAVRRSVRNARLGPKPKTSYDDLWSFDVTPESVAVLRLGHFVTWQMKSDWKAFLNDAFDRIARENVRHLLIDLRGCEGGSGDAPQLLASRILDRKIALRTFETRTAFDKVPERFFSALETWDRSAFDLSARVTQLESGGYRLKPSFSPREIGPFPKAFDGKIWVAIDASNSSGGFLLAWQLLESGRVTLIGEETGGSRRGLNAGQMFFLKLPHSGLKVDIPIYASFPTDDQPDAGVQPQIRIPLTADDVRRDRDPVLEFVWRAVQPVVAPPKFTRALRGSGVMLSSRRSKRGSD